MWLAVLCLALSAGLLLACQGEPPPAPAAATPHTEAARLGDVEITIKATEVVTPEVVDPDGRAAMLSSVSDRAFVVTLEFKNVGQAPVTYRPLHNAATGQRDTTPLLFKLPEGDEKLTAIPAVRLGENYFLLGQLQSEKAIAPGSAVVDKYLFRVPGEEAKRLLLTVPAPLFGGSAGELARFEMPNAPTIVSPAPPGQLGQPYKKGPLEVTITSVRDEYVEAELVSSRAEQEKLKYPYAYTVEPILRIDVELKNTGSEPLYYDPGHRANDSRGIELTPLATNRALRRFKLANAEATAKGQLSQVTALEPGKTYKDAFLFQRPPTSGDTELHLAMSGHIFGVEGLLQFKLPYSRTEPPRPDLEPYKKDAPPPPESPTSP